MPFKEAAPVVKTDKFSAGAFVGCDRIFKPEPGRPIVVLAIGLGDEKQAAVGEGGPGNDRLAVERAAIGR